MHHGKLSGRRMQDILHFLTQVHPEGASGRLIMEAIHCLNPATEISALRHALVAEGSEYEIPPARHIGQTESGAKVYWYKVARRGDPEPFRSYHDVIRDRVIRERAPVAMSHAEMWRPQ